MFVVLLDMLVAIASDGSKYWRISHTWICLIDDSIQAIHPKSDGVNRHYKSMHNWFS